MVQGEWHDPSDKPWWMGLTRHLAGTHAEEAHVGQHLVQPLEDTPARYSSWVVASLEQTVRAAVEHANLEEVALAFMLPSPSLQQQQLR